ncbi:hypothetical protein HEP87_64050 [Streptomyces sp. S1D4-11]|nr:hypothetical protein [Streptomyces sp. S1D4-11]
MAHAAEAIAAGRADAMLA